MCLQIEEWQPLSAHIDKVNGEQLDELGYCTLTDLFTDGFSCFSLPLVYNRRCLNLGVAKLVTVHGITQWLP